MDHAVGRMYLLVYGQIGEAVVECRSAGYWDVFARITADGEVHSLVRFSLLLECIAPYYCRWRGHCLVSIRPLLGCICSYYGRLSGSFSSVDPPVTWLYLLVLRQIVGVFF